MRRRMKKNKPEEKEVEEILLRGVQEPDCASHYFRKAQSSHCLIKKTAPVTLFAAHVSRIVRGEKNNAMEVSLLIDGKPGATCEIPVYPGVQNLIIINQKKGQQDLINKRKQQKIVVTLQGRQIIRTKKIQINLIRFAQIPRNVIPFW